MMKTFHGLPSKSDEKCSLCGKPIEKGPDRVQLPGALFHSDCFKCAKCGESLKSISYGILEGAYYCKKHHSELLKEGGGLLRTRIQPGSSRTYSTQAMVSPRVARKPLLQVTIVKAENLAAKDDNGKSDPYVQLTVRGKTFQTKIKKETLNPEWNETFEILAGREDRLKIQCWDYDEGAIDDFLGQAYVELGEILEKLEGGASCEEVYTLEPMNTKVPSDISGTLHVNYQLQSNERSDLQNKDKILQDRFSKFLELCKYSAENVKDWLSIPTYDNRKRKFNDVATAKAKQISEHFKRNASVPLSLIRDFKELVTERAFIRAFTAQENSIENLVLFLLDPNVKPGSQNDVVTSPMPEESTHAVELKSPMTTPRNTLTTTAIQRTKSLVRVPVTGVTFTQPVVTFSETDTEGLHYEINGRNAAGGTEGTLCTFSVFFRVDGQPIPSPPEKEDLQVFVECPGTPPSLMIMPGSSGVGYYQIGLKPNKAGQHWFDFVWKGKWCKAPFHLKIQNKNNSNVPDHPYVGEERKKAGVDCSPIVIPQTPRDGNVQIQITEPKPEPVPEPSAPRPTFVVPKLVLDLPSTAVKCEPLLEDQIKVRTVLVEIIRDYLLSNAKAAYILVDPVVINAIVECIAEIGIESQNVSLFGLLGYLPTVSRVFEGIRWDGRSVVISAMKHFQQVVGEQRPYENLVWLLKNTESGSYALTALILVNSLLDGEKIEERCAIRNQLVACDILGAIKGLRQKFSRNSSVMAQITEFEQEMSTDERNNKESEAIDPKVTIQSILDKLNNTPQAAPFANIIKGLSAISSPLELHKSDWFTIEHYIENLTNTQSNTLEERLKFEIRKHSEKKNSTNSKSPYSGSTPTKNLRNFAWNEIDSSIDSTVFSQFKLDSVKLDTARLEDLFTENEKPSAKISLLTTDRKTEVSILLSKFSRSNQDGIAGFKDLVLNYKLDKLTEPLLQEIFSCLPHDTERRAWEEWLSANPEHKPLQEVFTPPDIFHHTIIYELKDILQRIYLFKFSYKMKKIILRLKEAINTYSNVASSLEKSTDIPKILEVVLAIGRFINSKSSSYKDFSSFDIQLLPKLKEFKTNDGRSLLDIVVAQVAAENPLIVNWYQPILTPLIIVSRMSWASFESDFQKAKQEVDYVHGLVKNVSGNEALNYFERQTTEFNSYLTKKDEIHQNIQSIAKKYALNSYYNPEDVYRLFADFAQDWKVSAERFSKMSGKNKIINTEKRKADVLNRTQVNASKTELQKKVLPKKHDESRDKAVAKQIKETVTEIITRGVVTSRKETQTSSYY